jgi:hypothetical protein
MDNTIDMTPYMPNLAKVVDWFSEDPDPSLPVGYIMSSLSHATHALKKNTVLAVAGGLKSRPDILFVLKKLIGVVESPDSSESRQFIESLQENTGSVSTRSANTGKTVSDWANVLKQEAKSQKEIKSWGVQADEADEDDFAPLTPQKLKVKNLQEEPEAGPSEPEAGPSEPEAGPSEPEAGPSEPSKSVQKWLKIADENPEQFKAHFKQSEEIFNSFNPRRIIMCRYGKKCTYGTGCGYAHSCLELEVMRKFWEGKFKMRGWEWKTPDN